MSWLWDRAEVWMWRSLYCPARSGLMPWRLILSLFRWAIGIMPPSLTSTHAFRFTTPTFGSNLLGAMVGGFGEYFGMITGMKALLLVVVVFYLASLLIRLRTPQLLP